jgi:hypothetical protein
MDHEQHEFIFEHIERTREIEVATELGKIVATLESIDSRLEKVEHDVKSVVATVNRWKGATAILIVVGGLIGWFVNLFVKGNHS